MSDRLKKLYGLPAPEYNLGSPIIIAAGNLLQDTASGRILAQLKLKSLSDNFITAATVSLSLWAVNGDRLPCTIHQYLDLSAYRDSEFGQKTAIYLQDNTARSFSVAVSEVVFKDGTVWKAEDETVLQLPAKQNISDYFSNYELCKQFRIENGKDSPCVPLEVADLWYCTCGAINHKSEQTCHACRLEFKEITKHLDVDYLNKQQTERAKKEAAAKQVAKQKNIKIASIAVVAALVISAVPLYLNVLSPMLKYNRANKQLDAGDYITAISTFEKLGDYKDSVPLKEDAILRQADALFAVGNYAAALEYYEQSINRASEKIKECHYQMLAANIENEDWDSAIEQYSYIKDYLDASALMNAVYLGQARDLIEAGNYGDALDVISKYSGDSEEVIELTNTACVGHATALMETSNYADALAELEKFSGESNEVTEMKSTCTYQNALTLYEKKDYEEAATAFTELLKDSTYSEDSKEGLYLSAKAIYETDTKAAEKHFQQIKDYKDSSKYIPNIPKVTIATMSNSEKWATVTLENLQGTWKWYSSVSKSEDYCDTIKISGSYGSVCDKIAGEVGWSDEGLVSIKDRSAQGNSPMLTIGESVYYISYVTSTYFQDAGRGIMYYKQ